MERFKCDFCGQAVDRVRRVALDRGYDRLSQRHAVRYACEACSLHKDTERQDQTDRNEKDGRPPVDAPPASV